MIPHASPISLKVKMLIIIVTTKLTTMRMKFRVCSDGCNFWYHSPCVLRKRPTNFHQMTKRKNGFAAILNWLLRVLFSFEHKYLGKRSFMVDFWLLKKIFYLKEKWVSSIFCYYYPLTMYQQVAAPHWLSLLKF